MVLLLMLGLPGFSGWPNTWFVQQLQATGLFTLEIAHVIVWVAYAGCVWLVVLLSVGPHKLLAYLGAAFVLALTVALLGAILRGLFPLLAAGLSREATSFKLIRIFINIIIFLPYSVLFINSFSAKKLIDRVAHLDGRYRTIGLHLALAFRVFQHTGEVVFNLFQIWTEEYPEKILPRNSGDSGLSLVYTWKFVGMDMGLHPCLDICLHHPYIRAYTCDGCRGRKDRPGTITTTHKGTKDKKG